MFFRVSCYNSKPPTNQPNYSQTTHKPAKPLKKQANTEQITH